MVHPARLLMRRLTTRALISATIVCGLTASTRIGAHDPIGSRVTWTGDIERIFQARCVGCHAAGSRDPMPLTTYEEAQPWTGAIRQQVLSRRMPIWHAARGFGDFANDPSLTPLEIALIAAWANAGGPRGTANGPDTVPSPRLEVDKSVPAARMGREIMVPCGMQPMSGRLLAVNPKLEKGGSVMVAALSHDGQRQILAWIRDYDPQYPTTYWFRTPVTLSRGSRLEIAATGECRLAATMAR